MLFVISTKLFVKMVHLLYQQKNLLSPAVHSYDKFFLLIQQIIFYSAVAIAVMLQ